MILFLAVKASLKHCILKVPSFIIIFPKLSESRSSGEDLMASPYSLIIVKIPPLNSNKPSEDIAVLYELIIYSPSDFSKVIDT